MIMAATRKSVTHLDNHLKLAQEVNATLLAEIKQVVAENKRLKKIIKSKSPWVKFLAWLAR